MQVRIKNDLDGLGVPDCHGLFSYLAADLRISEVEKSLILKGFRGLSSDIKSEAIWDIVRLMRLKVITYDDLSKFSGELQQKVKRIIEICKK